MKQLKLRFILSFLCCLFIGFSFAQNTEEEIQKVGIELFEDEKYVEASDYYLRLITMNPRSFEYNYRYGTCLIYTSVKKKDAFKYLNYAVSDPNISIEAYYFLGKAYHLNYSFNDAIKNYQLYQQKAGSKAKKSFDVVRQIEMCENGKKLLSNITEIVVQDKKEIATSEFFRLYNLENIGGQIIVAVDFQSKIDKKKKFTPVIHFPSGTNEIYYASYGESSENKDIYKKTKLPNGEWSLPQKVTGPINTNYDEDFPYFNQGTGYLYFSSKGHNSMGGYDVFRAKLNDDKISFGEVENIDFAISTPDDDVFYVVDSIENNAYFASSRQSSGNKLYVYKVKVDRIPLQIAVIKGQFVSQLKPDVKKVQITVIDFISGNKVGTFTSNEKGGYLITFPKAGKYIYEMKVGDAPEIYKSTITIPFSKVFTPLKQGLLHDKKDETEFVRVQDQFGEKVEGAEDILAEIIKQHSELNVNIQNFNLEEIKNSTPNEVANGGIFKELGIEENSSQSISLAMDKLVASQEAKTKQQESFQKGALVNANENVLQMEKLQASAKELVAKSNTIEDPEEKLKTLLEAQNKMTQYEGLKEEFNRYIVFSDSVGKSVIIEKERLKNITNLREDVNKLAQKNDFAAVADKLEANKTELKNIASLGKTDNGSSIENSLIKISKDLSTIETQIQNYTENESKLRNEIAVLAAEKEKAKEKNKAEIQSKINQKQAELDLVSPELANQEKKKIALNIKKAQLEKELSFIQNVTLSSPTNVPNKAEVLEKKNAVDTKNVQTLDNYIDTQVAKLKDNVNSGTTNLTTTNPKDTTNTLNPKETDVTQETISAVRNAVISTSEKEKVLNEKPISIESLTEKENLYFDILTDLKEAEKKIPSSSKDERKEINQLKEQFATLLSEVKESKEKLPKETLITNTSQVKPLTKTETILQMMPNYETRMAEAVKSENSEEKNAVDEQLVEILKDALVDVENEKKASPNDVKLIEKASKIKEIINEKEVAITIRKSIETKENIPSIEELRAALLPNSIPSSASESEKIGFIEEQIRQLEQTPTSDFSKDKKEIFNQLLSEEKQKLEQLKNNQPSVQSSVEKKTFSPKYEENIQAINTSTKSSQEKSIERLREEQKVLDGMSKLQSKLETQLMNRPNNTELQAQDAAIKQQISIQESLVFEQRGNLTSEAMRNFQSEEVKKGIFPSYTSSDENLSKEAKIKQEEKLQAALIKEQKRLTKLNEKGFVAENQARTNVVNELITDSENKVVELETGLKVISPTEDITADLGDDSEVLTQKYAEKESAEKAISTLKTYAEKLEEQKKALDINSDSYETEAKKIATKQEIVQRRIATIEVDIENLNSLALANPKETITPKETVVPKETIEPKEVVTPKETITPKESVVPKETNEPKEVVTPKETITPKETVVPKETTEPKEVEIPKEIIVSSKPIVEKTNTELKEGLSNSSTPATANFTKLVAKRTLEVDGSTPAVKQQNNSLLSASVSAQNIIKNFRETGNIVADIDGMETVERRLLVEKGQISTAISQTKDEKIKGQLIEDEAAIKNILTELKQIKANSSTVNSLNSKDKAAMELSVSMEEERKIASTGAYQLLEKQQVQIVTLNKQRNDQLDEIKLLKSQSKRANYSDQTINEAILGKQKEVDKLNEIIVEKKRILEEDVQKQEGNELVYRNLLQREVPSVSNEMVQKIAPNLAEGFKIVPKTKTPQVIKMNTKMPGGLVYRLQIGAFAKPIPKNLFNEFTPISSESTQIGLTRYVAGYFGEREKAENAKNQVHKLGYKDAFLVVYCDGVRVSFAEAKRMEEQKTCATRNQEGIMIELVEEVVSHLPKDSLEKMRPKAKVSDYNKAPDAVPAYAVEEKLGLFYTVQVGVYNKPASAIQVKDISPLITKRLENGQLRYSSGIFHSIKDAKPKKNEAVSKGIEDAFITAYFNGERISLEKAKELLAEKGAEILEPIPSEQFNSTTEIALPIVRSKEQFNTFPNEEISVLKQQGNYYYDTVSKRIISENKKEDNLKTGFEIATSTYDKYERFNYSITGELGEDISGAMADYFIRHNLVYYIEKSFEGKKNIHILMEEKSQGEKYIALFQNMSLSKLELIQRY